MHFWWSAWPIFEAFGLNVVALIFVPRMVWGWVFFSYSWFLSHDWKIKWNNKKHFQATFSYFKGSYRSKESYCVNQASPWVETFTSLRNIGRSLEGTLSSKSYWNSSSPHSLKERLSHKEVQTLGKGFRFLLQSIFNR